MNNFPFPTFTTRPIEEGGKTRVVPLLAGDILDTNREDGDVDIYLTTPTDLPILITDTASSLSSPPAFESEKEMFPLLVDLDMDSNMDTLMNGM